MSGPLADLDVLVLAGGLGSRLEPTLGDIPKVLAPVEGRAFLDYVLDFLARQGVRKVVLSLGHLADKVLIHIAAAKLPLRVETVVEKRPLGTAGAIAFARTALSSDPVLVLNGDTWLDIDLTAMLGTHREPPVPLATIACVLVDDTRRYGRIDVASDGSIHRFVEKEDTSVTEGLVNGGAYLLSAKLLDSMAANAGPSLERDVLAKLPSGALRAHILKRANFIDIGTPESYAHAGALIRPQTAGGWAGDR
jgi:NDP-sugar pyrophosphorylase family protein